MKKSILKLEEARNYTTYQSSKTSLTKKIIQSIFSIFILFFMIMINWIILKIIPGKSLIPFTDMLPLALIGGIALYFLGALSYRLIPRVIEFRDKYLFLFAMGTGTRIDYHKITGFYFEKIEENNRSFQFLIFGVEEKQRTRIITMEIDPHTPQSDIIRAFNEKEVFQKQPGFFQTSSFPGK